MEAAGRGGAGKRTVRQRDPTWALRCPAFPSLKYYSVRREREPRSPARPRRRFHATSNTLSTPPRHGPRIVRVLPRGWTRTRSWFFFSLPAGQRRTRQGLYLSGGRPRCVVASDENGDRATTGGSSTVRDSFGPRSRYRAPFRNSSSRACDASPRTRAGGKPGSNPPQLGHRPNQPHSRTRLDPAERADVPETSPTTSDPPSSNRYILCLLYALSGRRAPMCHGPCTDLRKDS